MMFKASLMLKVIIEHSADLGALSKGLRFLNLSEGSSLSLPQVVRYYMSCLGEIGDCDF